MSMANNDVTYAEKWDTMPNNAALKKMADKFFDRSVCYPHCPVSWAPEVLELLERLDKEFGIARNEQTIKARYPELSLYKYLFVATFNNAKYTLTKSKDKDKVLKAKESIKRDLQYALKVFNVRYTNPILNKVLRPKIHLSQIKEKFGYLTVYFQCDEKYKEYINNLIYETTIKLATKGAYYPLEQITRKSEDERDSL